FKDNPAIPIVAYEMIVTGESTGNLGEMLEKVSDYYDGLNRNSAAAIKSLIEPALIIFLAAVVGVVILSVILPMFSMYNSLSS
ncbi:MAG: type II secretion system F family protein, partial [Bacilli bacterium]|nr:type II secretion system F family protein [Bacilli bacterium]